MSELVALSKRTGELVVLHPLYTEPKGAAVESHNGWRIVAFAEKQDPKGYIIEHPEGCMVVGPNIEFLMEILGELDELQT